MAWDSTRGRLVVTCGNDGLQIFNDTWEWDGTTWTQPNLLQAPDIPSRSASNAAFTMAYDSVRDEMVLAYPNGQTWVLANTVPAVHAVYGTGCPGAAVVPILGAFGKPALGNPASPSISTWPRHRRRPRSSSGWGPRTSLWGPARCSSTQPAR